MQAATGEPKHVKYAKVKRKEQEIPRHPIFILSEEGVEEPAILPFSMIREAGFCKKIQEKINFPPCFAY